MELHETVNQNQIPKNFCFIFLVKYSYENLIYYTIYEKEENV